MAGWDASLQPGLLHHDTLKDVLLFSKVKFGKGRKEFMLT